MKRLLILPILPVLHAGTQHIPDTPCSAKRDRAVADQECACCLQIPKTLQMALDSPGTLHSLSPTPISVHETQFGSYSTMSSQCRHLLVQVCLWPVERKLCSWKLDWSQDKEPSGPSSTHPLYLMWGLQKAGKCPS